jgi:outer membrane protein OmpA-like peptidoglycan-associated protein
MRARILPGILLSLGASAYAGTPAKPLSFVACPIVQDTQTVPCWLADYEGERYYLTIQIDSGAKEYPPSLGHKALVEGTPTEERICGGVVLKDVKISVLPDRDESCNTMLPAVDEHTVPFAPRGPGPREKLEVLRAKGLRPPAGARPPQPQKPTPPYEAKEFTVYYQFDWQIATRDIATMTNAMRYARDIGASKVEITGYRAAPLLSSGERIVEKDFLPRRRAQVLAETLVKIGVPQSTIKTTWVDEPQQGSGEEDWKLRKATIRIVP